jgi:hypothetical protein
VAVVITERYTERDPVLADNVSCLVIDVKGRSCAHNPSIWGSEEQVKVQVFRYKPEVALGVPGG